MTWSYVAGSSTPTYAGLADVAGLRINDVTGSYISEHLAGIIDSPPVRTAVSDLPSDHGAFVGPLFYGPRDIQIVGRIKVSTPDDVPAARDYMKGALALLSPDTSWTLIVNMRGWATRRQCIVRLNGPIVFEEPETVRRKGITRDFTIPLLASDPILYDADNLRSVDIPMTNTPTTVTGSGTMPVPFKARFTGPWNTAASLIRISDGAKITLSDSVAAGAYVDVDLTDKTNPSAVKSDGTNMFGDLTDQLTTFREVSPGASSWRAAGSSGTTGASKITITYRDGWL